MQPHDIAKIFNLIRFGQNKNLVSSKNIRSPTAMIRNDTIPCREPGKRHC